MHDTLIGAFLKYYSYTIWWHQNWHANEILDKDLKLNTLLF